MTVGVCTLNCPTVCTLNCPHKPLHGLNSGAVREPAGSTLTGIVPTNTYLCSDGKHVVIGANGTRVLCAVCYVLCANVCMRVHGFVHLLPTCDTVTLRRAQSIVAHLIGNSLYKRLMGAIGRDDLGV